MAMSADESADLTRPGAWTFADPPLGNPASIYSNEMRALFDVAFRADQEVGLKGFGGELGVVTLGSTLL